MFSTQYIINSQDKVLVPSANDERVFINERVFGNFKIERGRAFPDPTRTVVVRAMAWTVVAAKVTCIGYWNTPCKQQ